MISIKYGDFCKAGDCRNIVTNFLPPINKLFTGGIIQTDNQFGLIDLDNQKKGGTFNLNDFGPFGGGAKS